jgi:hypothetical protein
MQTLQLNPKDQGGIIDQMLKLKASVNYHNAEILPNYKNMQVWETNEYSLINNANLAELERLENHIIKHERLFNSILCEYGYTVTIFLIKFIK